MTTAILATAAAVLIAVGLVLWFHEAQMVCLKFQRGSNG